jgi:hypothetical protein
MVLGKTTLYVWGGGGVTLPEQRCGGTERNVPVTDAERIMMVYYPALPWFCQAAGRALFFV